MATHSERAAAEGFARRRVAQALHGSSAQQPESPLRRTIAAVCLAGLVYGGIAASTALRGGLPAGWDTNSVVVTGSGARYVGLDGVLYPVVNASSARLLVPASSFHVVTVSDDQLTGARRGASIGIVGGPESVPGQARLAATGWTACVSAGQLLTQVQPDPPAAPASGRAALVRTAGELVIVTDRVALPVPAADATAVLRALRLDTVAPVDVPQSWVDLFPAGPPLVPLRLDGSGAAAGASLPRTARVGSVLVVDEETPTPRRYLVTSPGRLSALSPLGYALYRLGADPAAGGDLTVTAEAIAAAPTAVDPPVPIQWPAVLGPSLLTRPCAMLLGSAGGLPTTTLALVPATSSPVRTVPVGGGALVRPTTGGATATGPVQLIDDTGTAYPVPQADTETLGRLGYTEKDIAAVPVAWTRLFPTGPPLGITEAARPVVPGSGGARTVDGSGDGGTGGSAASSVMIGTAAAPM